MFEVNYDGLVGPTHNYAGLSSGNLASTSHASLTSRPREAALQGLEKMRRLHDLGLKQGVLPPQERPSVETLRQLGFRGEDAEVLAEAARLAPRLLTSCSSASSMWTANAATVAPSRDTADGKVHFTVANLVNKFHRSIEAPQTERTLRALFPEEKTFVVHSALPATEWFGDEGAANHTRLARRHGERGLHFFVYGKSVVAGEQAPRKFPARQTREASEAVARRHGLGEAAFFAQQAPEVIDAGVFHNDVIAVGNEDVLFHHEKAFLDSERMLGELRERFRKVCGGELRLVEVPDAQVSVKDAVQSYLFNSQLVTLPDGQMALIAPADCERVPAVKAYLAAMAKEASHPIRSVITMDLRQSMDNGGGPACLRLRVPLTEKELGLVNKKALFSPALHAQLKKWVEAHYREKLEPSDLSDPKLLEENRAALDELTTILGLGSIYPFQL